MQKTSSLMVRLDEQSNALLHAAAELRRVSVSDYVRSIVVGQAERELAAFQSQTIAMTADEQLAFWNTLSATPKMTSAQKDLGARHQRLPEPLLPQQLAEAMNAAPPPPPEQRGRNATRRPIDLG